MKPLCLILLSLVICSVYAQGQHGLKKSIDSLYQVDQQVQLDLKDAIINKASADTIKLLQSIKKETFDRHIPILKKIYSQYGYPTIKKVGTDASFHFFVLIQHSDSDPKFQASMLPVLKKLAKKGEVSLKDYAYLYDRVHRNMGEKQRYGTQLSYDRKGNMFDSLDHIIYPKDLESPEKVDKRRAAVGLGSLESYYEEVLKMLGRPRKKIAVSE